MILADTAIWIDHFRSPDPVLADLLVAGHILCHPFVIGEIALGSFRQRPIILQRLWGLNLAVEASENEVFTLIEAACLFGTGIGFVDAHLLASTRLTPAAKLWTRDRRLHDAAIRLGIGFQSDRPH